MGGTDLDSPLIIHKKKHPVNAYIPDFIMLFGLT